ncbi:hypothetical protein [Cerina litoralis]|uniref:hypothetical protein n=1 Tax=Cerina litoralis TaxID=2874477 RepID=UPI0037C04BC4
MLRIFSIIICLVGFKGFSQSLPTVTSKVDTTNIKIGEQIHFTVFVDVDSTAHVIFPEGQTFSPLEMVEALKTDTLKKLDKVSLQKIYALTQFDSGAYTLPRQRILINDKPYFTDSVQIAVASVHVDTLAQKMYDIKGLMEVQKSHKDLWKTLLWVLLGLLVVGGLLYWFVFRKKPMTEAEKEALLPPYDRAMLELKRLESSKYLIQSEYKEYYSELTDIVRSYLEEDVHISAMESTTDQLIDKIELLKDAGELKLDSDTIHQFKRILETADLVKFAKSRPENSVAEQDRKSIEHIVTRTKEALPEPTEEELQQKEEYLEELARKQQRKKWLVTGAIALGVLLISTGAITAYYGPKLVWDSVTGHPTKKLLDGEWITSTYGYPPITVSTPKVLIRQDVKIPAQAKAQIKDMQTFRYQEPKVPFTIAVTSTEFTQPVDPDFDKTNEQLLKHLEENGAKNIVTKKEEYSTMAGVKGLKTYGSGKFILPGSNELVKGKYIILSFGGKGFQQQILLTWMDGDPYAEQIVERILVSVDVKTDV